MIGDSMKSLENQSGNFREKLWMNILEIRHIDIIKTQNNIFNYKSYYIFKGIYYGYYFLFIYLDRS